MAFKDLLPTSFEVTFIPLVQAYVWFFIAFPFHIGIAAIGPALYLGLCAFFIAADALDRMPLRLLICKVLFCLSCVAPMLLLIGWIVMFPRVGR
jgi:hypothetical protein